MARTEIKLNKISQFNSPLRLEAPMFENAMEASIKVSQMECDKMVLLFRLEGATSAGSVFIRAGDGIQAINDLEVSIPSMDDNNNDGLGTVVAVCIESGRFKIMNGADKGKIFIDGNQDVGVLAIELP